MAPTTTTEAPKPVDECGNDGYEKTKKKKFTGAKLSKRAKKTKTAKKCAAKCDAKDTCFGYSFKPAQIAGGKGKCTLLDDSSTKAKCKKGSICCMAA
jgi:hypothetical protein